MYEKIKKLGNFDLRINTSQENEFSKGQNESYMSFKIKPACNLNVLSKTTYKPFMSHEYLINNDDLPYKMADITNQNCKKVFAY